MLRRSILATAESWAWISSGIRIDTDLPPRRLRVFSFMPRNVPHIAAHCKIYFARCALCCTVPVEVAIMRRKNVSIYIRRNWWNQYAAPQPPIIEA